MKYNLALDRRIVIWARDHYCIEAENTDEAIQKILNNEVFFHDSEYLYETESPIRNLTSSDIENTDDEIIDLNTDNLIWSGIYDS